MGFASSAIARDSRKMGKNRLTPGKMGRAGKDRHAQQARKRIEKS
jgi:hypothetical protein